MQIKLNPILSQGKKYGYFPDYLFKSEPIKINRFYYNYYKVLLALIRIILKWRLGIFGSLYKEYKKEPAHQDVENIYTREAKTYEFKHHLTTNFRDTWWRRQVGLEIINYIGPNKNKQIKILDIATGIGLSLEEMFKVFKLFNVKVQAIGLDYNQKMLHQARKVIFKRMKKHDLLKKGVRQIRFVRGDARNLIEPLEKGLECFLKNSFDCLTIMFGIGGIDSPLKSIKEQLSVLKPNGILVITDIHQPISQLKEKWPWFIGQKNANAFTIMSWGKVTKPLVLASLWGWRDPSAVFYLAGLIVDYDKGKNIYYGFKRVSLFLDNEFWWFKLPVIPTAKIVLKKIEISKEEFEKRLEAQS